MQTSPESPKEIKMGNTQKGIEFYKKVEELHNQGIVVGKLYTESDSDAVVDVNPESQSVQLGLKYFSIKDKLTEQDKSLILDDFNAIKELAESDKTLVDPSTGKLNIFVITVHNNNGKAIGEYEQMTGDELPVWQDWK